MTPTPDPRPEKKPKIMSFDQYDEISKRWSTAGLSQPALDVWALLNHSGALEIECDQLRTDLERERACRSVVDRVCRELINTLDQLRIEAGIEAVKPQEIDMPTYKSHRS